MLTLYLSKLLPDTSAPVLPVSYAAKKDLFNNSIRVTWNKNAESDLKGYRVYYGGYSGFSFTSFQDAGSDTSIDIAGLTLNDEMGVTAYDISADGINDQYDGHESWFTLAVPDSTVGIHTPSPLKNEIAVSPNPSEGEFTIHLPLRSSEVLINIYDAEGKKLMSSKISGSSSYSFSLGHPGIYLLEALSAAPHPVIRK